MFGVNEQQPSHDTLSAARPTRIRYWVLGWLCVAATVAYMSRYAISAAETTIREDLTLSVTQMGWVLSAFFWGYALAQIPAGWLGQRWGTRRALTLYAIVWSLAAALTGLAWGFVSLLAARLVFGVAQAGIFPCAANTIRHWLPTSRRAVASGALGSFMNIGGAAGTALTGLMLSGAMWTFQDNVLVLPPISWRVALALFALPGIVWAIAFYAWFRDTPREHSGTNAAELAVIEHDEEERASATTSATPWRTILNHPDMWLICTQQFFRAAAAVIFATWFPTYLQESRGVSTSAAGLLTTIPLLSFVVGGVAGGLIVDWLYHKTRSRRISRQGTAVVAMLGCSVFLLIAYFVEATMPAVLLIATGSLFAAFSGSCGYTITIDKAGDYVGPVFGAMNMSGNLGAAICPAVIAYVAENTAGSRPGEANWDSVLLVFLCLTLAAGIAWMLVNPNGTFFDDPTTDEPPLSANRRREP